MRIGVQCAQSEEAVPGEAGEAQSSAILVLALGVLREGVEVAPVVPLGRQHRAACACVDHRRDHDLRVVAPRGAEALLPGRFLLVVRLLHDSLAQLVGDGHAVDRRGQRGEAREPSDAPEVGSERLCDVGILDLDGDAPSVEARPMDLSDGGGRHGFTLEVVEELVDPGAKCVFDDACHLLEGDGAGPLLQGPERGVRALREDAVEVRDDLADLHRQALHAI